MSGQSLKVTNPYTEECILELPLLPANEVDGVVARARAAFETWRHAPMAERKALCEGFVAQFEANAESIARDITLQMGKPLAYSHGEVATTLTRARHMIAIAEETLGDEQLPEASGFVRYIRHEPLGVVLDVAAWNYPLLIAINVVVPAVLAGNAVIIKHSSRTPQCGEVFAQAFRDAGAPADLVQHVVADHATTSAFIQHPGVDYVSFTGSVKGGYEVANSASGRFIDVGLELGGKDPAYVCADAPLDFAAANCVDGAFFNAGQSCCAIERIYVDQAIYQDFVDAFVEKTRAYVLGDPMEGATTLGPLASKGAPAFLQGQIEEAVQRGGRLVLDPASFDKPVKGWFAAPAVVADAPQDSALMQEESFGPVIGILSVASEEEALRYMNDSPYGLTASIWTKDPERAIRLGERVETGTFFMNRCDYLDPALPWTGVKETGRGVSLSRYGLLQLSRRKSMHLRVEIPE